MPKNQKQCQRARSQALKWARSGGGSTAPSAQPFQRRLAPAWGCQQNRICVMAQSDSHFCATTAKVWRRVWGQLKVGQRSVRRVGVSWRGYGRTALRGRQRSRSEQKQRTAAYRASSPHGAFTSSTPWALFALFASQRTHGRRTSKESVIWRPAQFAHGQGACGMWTFGLAQAWTASAERGARRPFHN